jgi:hypothetical protein
LSSIVSKANVHACVSAGPYSTPTPPSALGVPMLRLPPPSSVAEKLWPAFATSTSIGKPSESRAVTRTPVHSLASVGPSMTSTVVCALSAIASTLRQRVVAYGESEL